MTTKRLAARLNKVTAMTPIKDCPIKMAAHRQLRLAVDALFRIDMEGSTWQTHTADRDAWIQRCADGVSTSNDSERLALLPADALLTIGLSGLRYLAILHWINLEY